MSRKQPARRERSRAKATIAERAEFGPPGHPEPARHIERLAQLVEPEWGEGEVQEYYTYVDVDLDRRLRRRGWMPVGDVVGESWFYGPSTPNPEAEPYPTISRQDAAAEEAAVRRRIEWGERALDRRYDIESPAGKEAAVAEFGPMPPMAGARVEAVEPTTIVVEANGYRVIPAGFADDAEDRTITNRHQLWTMLDEIEAVRHSGPYYRIRHFQ